MTVLELMERSGADNTNLTIAWIKDAVNLIQSNTKHDLKTETITITENTKSYEPAADLMAIDNISILDTQADQYKRIRRLAFPPTVTVDNSP